MLYDVTHKKETIIDSSANRDQIKWTSCLQMLQFPHRKRVYQLGLNHFLAHKAWLVNQQPSYVTLQYFELN